MILHHFALIMHFVTSGFVQVSDILRHFYNETNQMHNISNLFYFETTLYMFRTVSPSIIRSLVAAC